MEPFKTCALDSEEVTLTCHSFLSIYVTKVSYGRDSSTGREVCGGDKPNDFKSLGSGTCYDEAYNSQLLEEIASECHGTFNCTYYIPTTPLTQDCDGLRREVKINHTCGNNS